MPKNITDTGLDGNFLLNSLLRTMYISALQTIPELSEQIKLTRWVVEELLTFAKKEALVEIRGPSEKNYNIMRYALTNAGKESERAKHCGAANTSVRFPYRSKLTKLRFKNRRSPTK